MQEVWRTPQMIARSRKHTFYLLYVREGRLVVHQRGRTADIAPGNCVLVDGGEPYSFLFPENNRCVSIQIPQAWLQAWLPAQEDAVATPFAVLSRWGSTLAYMVGSLAETSPDRLALPPDVMADQLGALMALAVGHEPVGTTIHRQTMLHRIRQSLKERMQDPDLDPAAIATVHGISKRYLHALFAAVDTSFGAELMHLRLEQARRLFNDRRFDDLSIGEIGLRCGFVGPSHFARRFRNRYGAAPAAYRKALRS